MTSLAYLILSVFVIGTIFLSMSAVIIARHAYRRREETALSERMERVRPMLTCALSADEPDLAHLRELSHDDQRAADKLAWTLLDKFTGGTRTALVTWLIDSGAIDDAKRACRSRRATRRTPGIHQLGSLGDHSLLPVAMRLLYDRNHDVHTGAVRAIGRIGDATGADALVRILERRSKPSRNAIVMALVQIGPAALDTLRYGTTHPSALVRSVCVEALGLCKGTAALPYLHHLLSTDPEITVRQLAAVAVGRVGDHGSIETLARAVNEDADPAVRAACATALGRMNEPVCLGPLQRALLDDDRTVGLNAAEALTRYGQAGHGMLHLAASSGGPGASRAEEWLQRSALRRSTSIHHESAVNP